MTDGNLSKLRQRVEDVRMEYGAQHRFSIDQGELLALIGIAEALKADSPACKNFSVDSGCNCYRIQLPPPNYEMPCVSCLLVLLDNADVNF